ncbi:UNVERIFIED_CONTAM: hypothetical protein FKN15_013509 [Acipenser sinensis]
MKPCRTVHVEECCTITFVSLLFLSLASKVDEGEHDSTPSPQCKNSSRDKPQCKKHRETTPQEEYVKTLRTHSVKIPSLQDRHPLTVESTETTHSVCFNNSETQGNLKTLPHSIKGRKSSCQLDTPETHKGNPTGGTTFSQEFQSYITA